jgi:SAM-dependent methyltransferase
MWKDYTIEEARDDDAADDLEIVRIHVRSDPLDGDCRDCDCRDLENTDFDHRVFGIPLFVIDVQSLPGRTRPRDFVIAFDRDGQVSNCYEFHDKRGKVVQRDNQRGSQLSGEFEEILANKALKAIGPKVMIGDSRVLRNFAENYDKTRRASPSIVEVLRRHLRPAPDKVGLDIGCGTGNYTLPFAGQFRELIGLDTLDEMLAVARPKSDKIRWLLGDALNTGLEDASCDAVWLISTLHYFKGERQKLLFEEIYRLLRPGGVVVADTEFLEQHASLWVVDFFPSLRNRYRDACLSVRQYDSWLREICFTNVQFDQIDYNPTECDAALRIGQHDPKMYLRKEIRDGLPAFREMPSEELRKGLKRLEAAIADKSIDETIAAYRSQATMPGDVGFIVAFR